MSEKTLQTLFCPQLGATASKVFKPVIPLRCETNFSGTMVQLCAGCERPIVDRFLLNVLDRPWHVKCVQCCECNARLAERCFSREGKLFCKTDFFRYVSLILGCLKSVVDYMPVFSTIFYHWYYRITLNVLHPQFLFQEPSILRNSSFV